MALMDFAQQLGKGRQKVITKGNEKLMTTENGANCLGIRLCIRRFSINWLLASLVLGTMIEGSTRATDSPIHGGAINAAGFGRTYQGHDFKGDIPGAVRFSGQDSPITDPIVPDRSNSDASIAVQRVDESTWRISGSVNASIYNHDAFLNTADAYAYVDFSTLGSLYYESSGSLVGNAKFEQNFGSGRIASLPQTIGLESGVLGPGNYRLTIEAHALSPGGDLVFNESSTGTFDLLLRVPEAGGTGFLLLSALGVLSALKPVLRPSSCAHLSADSNICLVPTARRCTLL